MFGLKQDGKAWIRYPSKRSNALDRYTDVTTEEQTHKHKHTYINHRDVYLIEE